MDRNEILSKLKFQVLEPFFGICRLDAEADTPEWVRQSRWRSVTRTADSSTFIAFSIKGICPKCNPAVLTAMISL